MANLTYVPGNLITKCQFGPCVTAAFNDQCGHVRSNVWFLHVTVLTTLHSCGRSSHTGVCVSHTGVCVWLTLYKKVESVAIASALQTEAARRCASPYPLQLRHPCHVWSRRTYPLPSYSVSTADTLRYALTLTSFLWPLPLTFVYLSLHAPLRCLLTHLLHQPHLRVSLLSGRPLHMKSQRSVLTFRNKLENVAIANALQLEAAGCRACPIPFNTSSVSSLKSLSLSVAVLERIYCWYVLLCCELELWPRDLDLWPLTLNLHILSSVTWCNSVRNLSEIGPSAAELLQFELWPYDLEHITRALLCCVIVCTKFKLSQAIC